MQNHIVKTHSPLRNFFPLVRKIRQWCWKINDRTGVRLVISGGPVRFLDGELIFPENVGLNYATPLFWNGPEAYEGPTSRTISLLAGRSKLFLDVGSNIGLYSVYVGVKFPRVKTFAFEPVPEIWKKNRAFHRANRLAEENVLNVALSDCAGSRKIFLPVYDNALEEEQTATLNPHSWQAHEEKVTALEIQTVSLDGFAAKGGLPPGFCTLKIDVENCEAAVLRGGKNFIAERRPWIVCEILGCEEFDAATKTKHNNNTEVMALISGLRYIPFAITADGFFRMTAADFARPRGFKDFLLAPEEKISEDLFYFSSENLAQMLPPAP